MNERSATMSKQTRQEKIQALVNQINSQLDGYVLDLDKMIDFYQFRNQMNEKYSIRNCALIESQFKGAIKVAGYNQWKKEGVQVQKGNKAIYILAPYQWKMITDQSGKSIVSLSKATQDIKKRLDNNELKIEKRLSYRTVPVFDISQTDYPIQKYPEYVQQFYLMGQTEKFEELYSALENYRNEKNVGLFTEAPHSGSSSARGLYSPREHKIWIKPNLDQKQYLKTYMHEMAHANMHQNSTLEKGLKEYQAELTAGVVANYFGLEATKPSTAYIHSHIQDMTITDKEELVEEVLTVTNEMIQSVEQHLALEYQLTPDLDKEVNDLIALERSPEISNAIPNKVIDTLDLDKDNDGVIDRYDADERDSTVQTFGDFHEREIQKNTSINDRMDQLIAEKNKKKGNYQMNRER